MSVKNPSLSIIIPALNEAGNLPRLLKSIGQQKNVQLEIIVVDGGSQDNTINACRKLEDSLSVKLKLVSGEKANRAYQMNLGVSLAVHDDLLFLHADSIIESNVLLKQCADFINAKRKETQSTTLAGHFSLRFVGNHEDHKYYFYECKTHLNRPDSINGDQGLWISKHFFRSLGGFDESLPYMEDARLAQRVFQYGQWLTLPGTIGTSARRFEVEGFAERQILNSFLCNFNAMGVNDFFFQAKDVYREQAEARRLKLKPFLKLAHHQMNGDGMSTAISRWYQTGSYIASNIWQLAYAIDCRKNRKLGYTPGQGTTNWLNRFDRYLESVTRWPVLRVVTSVVTIFWFYSLFILK